ncbi:MAG TPA: type II toxin-antitoxin system RelE/ParE family toxin [Acidimicrobiales bacterium]|nr:type II toxin-antitoxin system RelE/ParE family toxin [Acidimicrobiales bacterium]
MALSGCERLAEDPRPPAATRLVGGAGEWRVRTGDYRVIYEIHDDELLVLVLRMVIAARSTTADTTCRRKVPEGT